MIVMENQPFSILEDQGFVELLAELKPKYVISSTKQFNETVLTQAYDTLKLITYIELSHSSLSFTCDMWKNRRQINHLYFQPRIALMKILILSTVFELQGNVR